MKKPSLKVYGLPAAAMENLRILSEKKYGTPNISHLARDLLLHAAENTVGDTDLPTYSFKQPKTRLELKLPPKVSAWLNQTAEAHHMTPNMVALDILLEHIEKTPVLSGAEIEVLRTSNYQLVAIGRNVNQIARRMNAGENVSLSSKQLADLKEFIDAHTGKVGRVLQTNRRRKRE